MDIAELTTVEKREFDKRYKFIKDYLTKGIEKENTKKAVVLGGAPGSGKSTYYKFKAGLENYVKINGDEFRRYHPHYFELAAYNIKELAKNTQQFSNKITEKLIKDLSKEGYNLVIEGTLRNPEVALKTGRMLREKGYMSELVVVACPAEKAWDSTMKRAEIERFIGAVPRFVDIEAYNNIVNSLENSVKTIRESNDCFWGISIFNRDGRHLFPSPKLLDPEKIMHDELHVDEWNKNFWEHDIDFQLFTQNFGNPFLSNKEIKVERETVEIERQ